MKLNEAYEAAENWYKLMGFVPPELEEIIATDSSYSYAYARLIIKGRFEMGGARH